MQNQVIININPMPTIFKFFGFSFLFYANDHEPIHIHVVKGKQRAKFTILPVKLIENNGLNKNELKMVSDIIEENQEIISEHWNKFFNQYK